MQKCSKGIRLYKNPSALWGELLLKFRFDSSFSQAERLDHIKLWRNLILTNIKQCIFLPLLVDALPITLTLLLLLLLLLDTNSNITGNTKKVKLLLLLYFSADLLEKIADEIQILACCNPLFVQIKLTDEIELLDFGRQYI